VLIWFALENSVRFRAFTSSEAVPSARFTAQDIEAANKAWRCTCGPVAIACMLNLTLDEVRPLVGSDYRGWMNPTQMEAALTRANVRFEEHDREKLYRPTGPRRYGCKIAAIHGITRIQFAGPWTSPGVPPRVAYRYTHWVASVTTAADGCADIFDINWGWMSFGAFLKNMRELALEEAGATGEWWPTHIYEVTAGAKNSPAISAG